MNPRLRLLGRASIFDGQQWLGAPLDKRFGLLAYLAYAGDWVERDKLAFLFWPDVEQSRARRALRYLIHRTKKLSVASELETQGGSLRWQAETDVHNLREALERQDWVKTVALYAGELLQGLHLDDSPEFMAWLELERRNLQALWRDAVLNCAAKLQGTGKHWEAANLLKKLVDAEELGEDMLQRYLRNACLGGQRELALRTYERFAAGLQQELGLEPSLITQELAEALRSHALGVVDAQKPSQTPTRPPPERLMNFPSESTSFVGRELELRETVSTLSQPSCRLLTLVGPGGIGKTRLAIRAAAEVAADYSDGVAFVPVASVSEASLLASAVTSALAVTLSGQEAPERQLLAYLQEKEMLLVLDNFEHLLKGSSLITSILETCPRVRVLVTSRERLNLSGEWLLQVGGMRLPEDEAVARLEAYDAVQLFLHRARQIQAGFVLSEETHASVLHICRLVGGAPLGIELAAGWLQLLTCDEIASEMSADLDVLSNQLRDLPERHWSLQAVFEHSWKLLSEKEHAAFRRLSVFQGGFTREAAEQAAEVSMRSLLSLLNKSLIKRSPSGRFDLHELVKQYAAEKLAELPDEERTVRDLHCAYYARFMQEREAWIQGSRQPQALREIEGEIDNVRAAWRWAAIERNTDMLELTSQALGDFLNIRGFYREGEETFRLAIANQDRESITLGRLLFWQGLFAGWLGLETAEGMNQRSLAILTRLEAPAAVVIWPHLAAGVARREQGELAQAMVHLTRALALARESGNLYAEARVLLNLGTVAETEGALVQAAGYHRQGIVIFRQIGDAYGLSMALGDLGDVLEKLGEVEAARQYYLEGLGVARGIGARLRVGEALMRLGALSYKQEQYEQAEAYYLESIAILKELGDKTEHAKRALTGLVETARALGKYSSAFGSLHNTLLAALALKDMERATRILVGIAELLLDLREQEKALELLAFALKQEDIEIDVRARAEQLYGTLKEQLPVDIIAPAEARGQLLRSEALAAVLSDWQRQLES